MIRFAVASRRAGESLMADMVLCRPSGSQADQRGIRISMGLILRFPHILCSRLWRLVHVPSYSRSTALDRED